MDVLTFRRQREKDYPFQLAQSEINIEPKRLAENRTYLILHDGEKVGFVSFRFKPDQTIYIYILAFEKFAQKQGFAAMVIKSLIEYGQKKKGCCFKGLSARIHKVNEPAINAAKKHGFFVTKEGLEYLDFMKPVMKGKEQQ